MATQTRAPTSDIGYTGTWSGTDGLRYTLVDDYPDTVPNDYLDHGTTKGAIGFGHSVFTVPSGSTAISVQVQYYDGEPASGANTFGSRIRVGGVWYTAATHDPSGSGMTAREDNWATNPSSGLAWTVDDVNGVGSYALDGVGYRSTDANPIIRTSCIQLQVTYTPGGTQVTGSLDKTLGAITRTIAGVVKRTGALTKTLGAVTGTLVGVVKRTGSFSKTLGALTLTASGVVTHAGNQVTGSLSKTLGAVTLSAAGVFRRTGSLSKTLGAVTDVASGTVKRTGSLSKTLGAVVGTASGAFKRTGTLSKTLGAVVGAATGFFHRTATVSKTLGGVSVTATGTVTSPEPPVAYKTKLEQIAQIVVLDAAAPVYVGFPGLKGEWTADITFLDLIELQVWVWLDELNVLVGPDSKALTLVSAPAYYDQDFNYDQSEYD